MTGSVPIHVPDSGGTPYGHSLMARWAVWLTAVFPSAIVSAIVTYFAGVAVGGDSAVEDNWLAAAVSMMVLVGATASLAASVLAVVAKIRGDRWGMLRLAMAAFPAFVAFLVLGELLWWE